MDFRFTNDYGSTRLDEVVAFMRGPRLWVPAADYPDFDAWAQRAHQELRHGGKRAIVGLAHGDVIGVLIYQRHKTSPDALELKHLSVRPDQRGRFIASFLLRNAELEGAREFSVSSVVADAKAQNAGIHFFLARHRYRRTAQVDLYGLGAGVDAVYCKHLNSVFPGNRKPHP
jgi:ribosomal protein S18 acetylase RimI-like enzyme